MSAFGKIRRYRSEILWMLCALIAATLLYSYGITGTLYGDEIGHTYPVVTGSEFWKKLLDPSMCHPPLYFVAAKAAYAVTGAPWSIRLPSLLFGLGTIVLMAVLARRFFGKAFFVPALCLAVVSPFLIEFAREGRAYAMLIFFSAALIAAFMLFLEKETWRRGLILSLVGVCGALTHYFFWFLLVTIAAAYLAIRRRVSKYSLAVLLVSGAVLLPVFCITFFLQKAAFRESLQLPWAEAYFSIPNFLGRLWIALNYGYSTFYLPTLDPARNVSAGTLRANWFPAALVVISSAGLCYGFARLALARMTWFGLLLAGALVPMALGILGGELGFYLLREKHLASVWVCYFLLLLPCMAYLKRSRCGKIVLVCYVVLIAVSLYHEYASPDMYSRRMNWTGLNQSLARLQVQENDVILAYAGNLDYLSMGKLNLPAGPVRTVTLATDRPGNTPIASYVEYLAGTTTGRIFLINHETDRHLFDPRGEALRTLASLRSPAEERFGRNLVLYVFR